MQESDRKKFAAAMIGLAEYYGKPLSPALITIYWNSLETYDLEAINRAISLHILDAEQGKFMPKVADLMRFIEGSTSDRANLAWSMVHQAIKSVGPYQTVSFADKIIHRVLSDMGGWIALNDTLTDEMPFKAKEFCNRYRNYSARREIPEHHPLMVGLIESDCNMRGLQHHIPEPISIGDATDQKKVAA